MDSGEILTRWTARAAMAIFFLGLISRITKNRENSTVNRWTWSTGCFVYLLHVVCAFQFVHHWSNSAAYRATSERTAAMVGLEWGGGLYVNYAFTLVWIGDVCWWWFSRDSYQNRAPILEWTILGFLVFIAFNASVIFAEGATRWVGAGACILLLGIWLCQKIYGTKI